MSANSRLTLATHALTLIAAPKYRDNFTTSERIAASVKANPVILRGLLSMLEKHHLVNVQRGSNAGWKLARQPEEITLLDVYRAVEPGSLFAMHHTPPNPRCDIGCSIGSVLEDVYANIQNTLELELARVTIADVLRDTYAATAALQ
ncbi:Rrf2 family transcriptional regulator [Ktedonosporobacter rubrisoli]|uniref:Rrf2 family transcriptional regulator n=1 Tax=Ktedonosporobacter rubrisoli TaxID=2509675 RepID=A0A4P6JJL4_KTERU|nr:Rrf2 family transcriptional regulator [Ktedonosporobacter rubrisoli]QBD75299.1 Rrf2 family transcriptional regulator [Ktedonosporobacter rubrisoli]